MSLALTSIDEGAVSARGGDQITLKGDFSAKLGIAYDVHIGPNGDATDPKAYSGRPGLATTIKPRNTGEMVFYAPDLGPGVYNLFLKEQVAGTTTLAANSVLIFPSQYGTVEFSMKKLHSPHYDLGARRPGALPAVVANPNLVPSAPTITGSYNGGDTVVSGTASNDLATATVYVDGVEAGSGVVLGGTWSVAVLALQAGETLTADVTSAGGTSALSSGVVVS